MKKIGGYTARGVADGSGVDIPKRIPLFDGRFDTGYVVTSFAVWSTNYNSDANADCIGKLSKSANSTTSLSNYFRADDANELAWASSEGASMSANDAGLSHALIDPNNLTIEDLFIYVRGNDVPINYMITMEKYSFSDWQGALAMAVDAADGE